MKKLAAILCLSALTTGAFAQGLVNFFNSATTLSSATINGTSSAAANSRAPGGAWYYGLLIGSGNNANAFTFTGNYATNLAVAGRFTGGANVAAGGWGAGISTNYAVAIWSASLGHDFQTAWLSGTFNGQGNFGLSAVATGIAGGAGQPASPSYNLFGGATGIQSGFNANVVGTVPEPTSMALAGLGAAALMIFRRRK